MGFLSKETHYHYYVVYKFTNKNGSDGWGCISVKAKRKILTNADIIGFKRTIKERYTKMEDLIITDWKILACDCEGNE